MEYVTGTSSGKYAASYPAFRDNQLGFESRTVADTSSSWTNSMRPSFLPQNLQQPSPPPYASASNEQKLEEMRLLLDKHNYPPNAYMALRWAKLQLEQGDDRFLNDALDNLRMWDKLVGLRPI
jgi:hypothetical protein